MAIALAKSLLSSAFSNVNLRASSSCLLHWPHRPLLPAYTKASLDAPLHSSSTGYIDPCCRAHSKTTVFLDGPLPAKSTRHIDCCSRAEVLSTEMILFMPIALAI